MYVLWTATLLVASYPGPFEKSIFRMGLGYSKNRFFESAWVRGYTASYTATYLQCIATHYLLGGVLDAYTLSLSQGPVLWLLRQLLKWVVPHAFTAHLQQVGPLRQL